MAHLSFLNLSFVKYVTLKPVPANPVLLWKPRPLWAVTWGCLRRTEDAVRRCAAKTLSFIAPSGSSCA